MYSLKIITDLKNNFTVSSFSLLVESKLDYYENTEIFDSEVCQTFAWVFDAKDAWVFDAFFIKWKILFISLEYQMWNIKSKQFIDVFITCIWILDNVVKNLKIGKLK